MPDSLPARPFVPDWFEVPLRLDAEAFTLVPLGAEHNEADYAAWMSSIDHIRATPGFEEWSWPQPMTSEENRADLVRHAADFTARTGFTYTVLASGSESDVVGCVYIYPLAPDAPGRSEHDVRVRSWVRADRAELDVALWQAVSSWLATAWPFTAPVYAPR